MYRDEQNRWGSSGRPPQERPTFRPASWRAQRGSYPPPRNDTWRPRTGGSTPRRRRPARSPHHPYASSPSHAPPPSSRPPTPTHHYPDHHPHHGQARPMTPQRPATPQRHGSHIAPPMAPQRPATPRRLDAPHSAPLLTGGATAPHYSAPPPYDHRNTRAPLTPAVAPPASSMPLQPPPPHFVNHRAPPPYTGAPPPQRYGAPQPTYAPLPSAAPIQPSQAHPRASPRHDASPATHLQQPMPPFAGAFRPATPPARTQVEVDGSGVAPRASWPPHRPPTLDVAAAVAAPVPPAPPQPQTPPAPPAPGGDAAFMAPGVAPAALTAAAPAPVVAPAAARFPSLRSKPLPQKAPVAAAAQSAPPPAAAQKVPAADAPREPTQAILDLEIGGSQSTVLLERNDDVFFVGVTQMDAAQRVLSFSPTADRVEVLVGPTDTATDTHMQCAKRIARALDARTDDVVLLSVAIADAEKSECWHEVTSAVERFASLRKQGKV